METLPPKPPAGSRRVKLIEDRETFERGRLQRRTETEAKTMMVENQVQPQRLSSKRGVLT